MTDPAKKSILETPPSGGGGDSARAVTIGVFAKHWTPGETKTRLASTLGDETAAEASRLFLGTTVQRISSLGYSNTLAFTPAEQSEAFEELTAGKPWTVTPQPSGTLGDRMRWFFDRAFWSGSSAAVLLGSDSPDFPVDAVEQAIELLTREKSPMRTVLGPSDDGGYWLVGARIAAPPIFGNLPWSTPELFGATIGRMLAEGWVEDKDFARIGVWSDVDNEEDLATLRARLAGASDDPALAGLKESLDRLLGS